MRLLRVAAFLLLAPAAFAQRWVDFRSGPFQIVATDDKRQARESLNRLEQVRHVMEQLLGARELKPAWPIRIVVTKNATMATKLRFGRDGWIASSPAVIPESLVREAAQVLLESHPGRLPATLEAGLLQFVSQIEARGPKLLLGKSTDSASRTRDWMRIHFFMVDPRYSGKLRVLLANLGRAMDPEPAYRNAFEKSPADVEKELDAYVAGARFEPVPYSGRPIDPEFAFPERPFEAEPYLAEIAQDPGTAYRALLNSGNFATEAHEGLGLLAVESGDKEGAAEHLKAAAAAGSRNARVYVELGDWRAAIDRNPQWADPYFRMAQTETDPIRKALLLKKAAEVEPRNARNWRALAEAYLEGNQYAEAGRAWSSAFQASASDAERVEIRKAREDVERRRADFEAAEKRRAIEEKERELERLKGEALARVRAAEEKANRGEAPSAKVVPWFEGPSGSASISGTLERVECSGGTARLVIRSNDKKLVKLLVASPDQVVIAGGGNSTLGCGVQQPPRRLTVEYVPKPNAKYGTAGNAHLIDFAR